MKPLKIMFDDVIQNNGLNDPPHDGCALYVVRFCEIIFEAGEP